MKIGTVISVGDTPNTKEFYVMVNPNYSKKIKKGIYVEITYQDKTLVGVITDIIKTNRYFSQIESVAEFELSGEALRSLFPLEMWEYTLIRVRPLGYYYNNKKTVERCDSPPSPGDKVYIASEETLINFLGLNKKGIVLGTLIGHNYTVAFDLNKFVRKHIAVLAMSGAGKSYTVSVILEELLKRKPQDGRIVPIVFDVHGEYTHFYNVPEFKEKVNVIQGSEIQFATSYLDRYLISTMLPQLSEIQLRELMRVISEIRYKNQQFNLNEVILHIKQSKINPRTKEAILGWLYILEETHFFGIAENPIWEKTIIPGKLIVINLSDIISLYKKQLIVTYVLYRLFHLRRRNVIPPVIAVLEEAHQFCPEIRREEAISKGIIETIAREGRKFYFSLCLISQRPVRLSTTALSQCNTNIILRITNPYDLQHIGSSSEHIDKQTLETISSLTVGEALITGEVVRFPVFIKVRTRTFLTELPFEESVEEVAKKFESKS
ncbi:MAG: ATP-binding protein [Candidatus Asgardarchaeia archaeon]